MPAASANGVRLDYELRGSGEPLVMVHGSWGDRHAWDAVLPGLAQHFRVLAYSRRGHSESTAPAGQGSIRDDVADAFALAEALGLGPFHLAGSSFGAIVALRMAAARPERLRALMVHEPPLLGLAARDPAMAARLAEPQARARAVLALLEQGKREEGARAFVETVAFGPGAWTQLPEPLRSTFVRNAPTWADEMREPEAFVLDLASLRAFQGPVLLTQGAQSPPFFAAVVAQVAAAWPHAVRATFATAGHAPHVESPQEYVERATKFFGR